MSDDTHTHTHLFHQDDTHRTLFHPFTHPLTRPPRPHNNTITLFCIQHGRDHFSHLFLCAGLSKEGVLKKIVRRRRRERGRERMVMFERDERKTTKIMCEA